MHSQHKDSDYSKDGDSKPDEDSSYDSSKPKKKYSDDKEDKKDAYNTDKVGAVLCSCMVPWLCLQAVLQAAVSSCCSTQPGQASRAGTKQL